MSRTIQICIVSLASVSFYFWMPTAPWLDRRQRVNSGWRIRKRSWPTRATIKEKPIDSFSKPAKGLWEICKRSRIAVRSGANELRTGCASNPVHLDAPLAQPFLSRRIGLCGVPRLIHFYDSIQCVAPALLRTGRKVVLDGLIPFG